MEEAAACCSICFEHFKDAEGALPRILHCGHSFCEKCLSKLPEATKKVTCPKCRQDTPTPYNNLPRNFDLLDVLAVSSQGKGKTTNILNKTKGKPCDNCKDEKEREDEIGEAIIYCPTCKVSLCKNCDVSVHTIAVLRKHERVPVDKAPLPKANCKTHAGTPLDFWCEQDGVAVCTSCCIAGAHKGHNIITIEDAWLGVRNEAEKVMTDCEVSLGKLEGAKKDNEKTKIERRQMVEGVTQEINSTFEEIRDALDARKRGLLKEVQVWEEEQNRHGAEEEKQLAEEINQLKLIGKEAQRLIEDKSGWIANPSSIKMKVEKERQPLKSSKKSLISFGAKEKASILQKITSLGSIKVDVIHHPSQDDVIVDGRGNSQRFSKSRSDAQVVFSNDMLTAQFSGTVSAWCGMVCEQPFTKNYTYCEFKVEQYGSHAIGIVYGEVVTGKSNLADITNTICSISGSGIWILGHRNTLSSPSWTSGDRIGVKLLDTQFQLFKNGVTVLACPLPPRPNGLPCYPVLYVCNNNKFTILPATEPNVH